MIYQFVAKQLYKDFLSICQENDNNNHEFEIRFGKISKKFNPNLDKSTWMKIYKNLKDNTMEYKLIMDCICTTINDETIIKRNINNFSETLLLHHQFRSLEGIYNDSKEYKYHTKTRIKSYTIDHLRYSHSLENNIEPIKSRLELIRLKKRCSIELNKFCRVDMTIIDIFNNKLEWIDTEYIVELEITTYTNFQIQILIDSIKLIFEMYFEVNEYIFNISSISLPKTMESQHLSLIVSNIDKYTVTEKADGIRMHLIIFEDQMYFKNLSRNIIEFCEPNQTKFNLLIFDGEYIETLELFLVFDLLLFETNGQIIDTRFDNLLTKIQMLNEKYLPIITTTKKKVSIKLKKFYHDSTTIFQESYNIWQNRDKLFNYDIDGLIYTPINFIDNLPIFKWKSMITIDVRVEYISKEDFTYFHHSTAYNKSNVSNWYTKHDNRTDIKYLRWTTKNVSEFNKFGKKKYNKIFLGKYGKPINNIRNKSDIVEYGFINNEWKFIKLRTKDKNTPNSYNTIKKNLQSINNEIQIEQILYGNIYDHIITPIEHQEYRKPWRKFNNLIKNDLLKTYGINSNTHLDLACGKLSDLHKYVHNNYKNVLAIDSSIQSIQYGINRLKTNNFIEKDYYWQYKNLKITLIVGDVTKNIINLDCCVVKEDRIKLQKFLLNNGNKFDTISCMFGIHYFFGTINNVTKLWNINDKKPLNNFIQNIKELLKKNSGKFFGIYLNADNITSNHMKFINESDKKLLYEIKCINEDTLQINNETWSSSIKITEPKINKDMLIKSFNDFNIIQIKNAKNYLQNYYTQKLSKIEKKLCALNDTFVMSTN